MTQGLLSVASHFYLFAAILYLVHFLRANAKVALAAVLAVGVGFVLHSGVIAGQLFSPVYPRLSVGLSLVGWALAGGFLLIQRLYRIPEIGVFVAPLLVGVVVPSVLLGGGGALPLPESLKVSGMPLHVLIAFAGIGFFALATGVSVAYLVLERQMKRKSFGMLFSRLPSLDVLDRMGDQLIRWGFVALSATLLSGSFLAKKAWGDWWRWDPKLMFSLVGWLVFAGLVQARLFAGWRGRRAALLTMIGFAILFGSYLGLKLFPTGIHAGEYR